jgi:glycosyltransferase involved in cell wall biosynthesis
VPYLVEHGRTAWLVEPDLPEEMAQALAHVLSDSSLRVTLREQGLALARACAWTPVGRLWLDLYERLARSATADIRGTPA